MQQTTTALKLIYYYSRLGGLSRNLRELSANSELIRNLFKRDMSRNGGSAEGYGLGAGSMPIINSNEAQNQPSAYT